MKKNVAMMMFFLCAFSIGLMAGCGSDDDKEDGGSCTSDAECKGDRICSNGACVSPGGNNANNANNANNGNNANNANNQNNTSSDIGDQCQTGVDGECQVACLERTGANDDFGYCSITCSGDGDCPSTGYICEEINNAASMYCVQGERLQKQPTGEACDDGAQCEGNLCYGGPDAVVGYCTEVCEDFTDCPDFWSCENVDGVAGTICVQD